MALWSILSCHIPEILLPFASFFLFQHLRNPKVTGLRNWPIVGMLPSLLLNVHHLNDWITHLLKTIGINTYLFRGPWFTHMDVMVTCDPDNVNHIFSTNFSNFPKGPEFSKTFDIVGNSIIASDGESWRIQRKIAHNLVSSSKFRAFVAKTSQAKLKILMDIIKHKAKQGESEGGSVVFDLQDVFQRFIFDNTCILVFGRDLGSLSIDFPTVGLAKAIDEAMEAIAYRFVIPESWWSVLKWLKIGKEKQLAEARETIDDFIYHQISMRRKEVKKSNSSDEGADLLSSYMDYKLEDEPEMPKYDDKLLRDTAFNLTIAARDTSGAALTWFFWLISMNPDVETKILNELRTISPELAEMGDGFEEKLKVFEAEKLKQLVYLHAALCETLRLFPPVPFNFKSVLQQQDLPSGETVGRRMRILIPVYAMGRMESIWGKDCLEFKPERWISERGRLKFVPSYKFMAFNAGPRICLGKEVAFTQMKMVAAALLLNFQFQVLEGHPVFPELSTILNMKKGLLVTVRER